MKVSWRDLEVYDDQAARLDHDERVTVLTAWRMTHRLPHGYAFGPIDAAHEIPGAYGPRHPAEVDWRGFPDRTDAGKRRDVDPGRDF